MESIKAILLAFGLAWPWFAYALLGFALAPAVWPDGEGDQRDLLFLSGEAV